MVKKNSVQQDLLNFKYIEDQVAKIKESMEQNNNNENDRPSDDSLEESEHSVYEMLHVQKLLLEDIQSQITELNNKKKRKWWKF